MAAYCQVYGVIHFTSPAGWLPVHWDQLRAQRSVTSMGKLYFLLLSFTAHMPLLMATSTFELGRRCWSSPHQCLSLYLTGRLIREAVWIRKSSNINRDEGSDRLRHVWDSILTDVWNRKSVLWRLQIVERTIACFVSVVWYSQTSLSGYRLSG